MLDVLAAFLTGELGLPLASSLLTGMLIIESTARETDWCGGRLVFGEGPDATQLLVNAPVPRSALITINPDTAVRRPGILRTVVNGFCNAEGAYCAPARAGLIQVGDTVTWLPVR